MNWIILRLKEYLSIKVALTRGADSVQVWPNPTVGSDFAGAKEVEWEGNLWVLGTVQPFKALGPPCCEKSGKGLMAWSRRKGRKPSLGRAAG